MAAEINVVDLTLMKTMQGYIWLEEPHRCSYKPDACLYQLSSYPMQDVDPNVVKNNLSE